MPTTPVILEAGCSPVKPSAETVTPATALDCSNAENRAQPSPDFQPTEAARSRARVLYATRWAVMFLCTDRELTQTVTAQAVQHRATRVIPFRVSLYHSLLNATGPLSIINIYIYILTPDFNDYF